MTAASKPKPHCFTQNSIQRKDIFLIGFITIVGGQYSGWNTAYGDGIAVSSLIVSILALGYLMMTLCLAEMTSALPFSGGVYGLARAFLHPLLGLLVASLELIMNIGYIAPSVYHFAELAVEADLMNRDYILLVCAMTYLWVIVSCVIGGKCIWRTVMMLGVTMMVFVGLYQFGSLSVANFPHWGQSNLNTPPIQVQSVLHYIPQVAPIFLGIQFLPLTSRCARQPKTDIPWMMLTVLACSILPAVGFMVLAGSQSPGIGSGLAKEIYPLRYGYSRILGISDRAAVLLTVPFSLGTIFGFSFFCARQMYMMAKSGLFPRVFTVETPLFGTPYLTIGTVAGMSFVLNVITFFFGDSHWINEELYLISSLASFGVFGTALAAYLVFQSKYSSLERSFRSPCQASGAYLGLTIFLFCLIGGAVFQEGGYLPIVVIVGMVILTLGYSLTYGRQIVFSEEEKEELFKAYLVNANQATKKRLQKKKKAGRNSHSRNSHSQTRDKDHNDGDGNSSVGNRSNFSQSQSTSIVQDPLENLERGTVFPPVARMNTTTAPEDHHHDNEDEVDDDHPQVKSVKIVPTEPVSAPTATAVTSSDRSRSDPIRMQETKSLSEKVFQFFSSKFNQILPEPSLAVDEEEEELEAPEGNTPQSPDNLMV